MNIALVVWFISIIVTVITFAIILIVLLIKAPGFTLFKKKKVSKSQEINEAQQLIAAAKAKAATIIREAKLFNKQTSSQIEKSLQEVSRAAINKTEEISANITNKTSQQLNSIIDNHNEKWQQTLADYEALTQEQLIQFRESLTKIIKQELTNTRESINQHRAKEEKRITQELEEQLPVILKKITGRSIPIEVHEDMVREALAKAKQDNILKIT